MLDVPQFVWAIANSWSRWLCACREEKNRVFLKIQRKLYLWKVLLILLFYFYRRTYEAVHGLLCMNKIVQLSNIDLTIFSGVDNNNYVNSVTTQPSSLQQPFNEQVDLLARNFFSKFCFYIKSVSRDSVALSSELKRLDAHLSKLDSKFFFGDTLTRFDHLVVFFCLLETSITWTLSSVTLFAPRHLLWKCQKLHYWAYLTDPYHQIRLWSPA